MAEEALAAFRSHAFDADAAWAAYLSRVEIPTNSAGDILKAKAKWFKRERAPDLDVAAALAAAGFGGGSGAAGGGGGSGAGAAAAPPPRPAAPPERPPPPPPAAGARARGAGAGGAIAGVPLDTLLLGANVAVLVAALLWLLPVLPGGLGRRMYSACLLSSFGAHLLQVVQQCGAPPTNMAGLQAWAPRALPSQAMAFALTALVLLGAPPATLALGPHAIAAAYGAAGGAAARFGGHPLWRARGAPLHAKLLANKQRALSLSAQLEITLGFYLVAMLLTPRRHLLAAYFIWQQLKQRYWSAEAGAHHRAVWGALDAQTRGLRAQAPILEKPLALARRWWMTPPPMAGQRP